MTESGQSSGSRWPLLAVVALAFVLRAWRLNAAGITADEAYELELSRKPIASMLRDEDDDLFPPLYRPTLALWDRLWRTEQAARWLNVLYGVGATAAVAAAATLYVGRRDAVWPTLLFACAPFHIHYCREGRAYALYAALAAVVFWAALLVWRSGRPRHWALLVVASAAAVWTHYFAGPLVVVVWAWVAAATWKERDWKPFVAALGALTILLSPSPYVLHRAMRDHPDETLTAVFDAESLAYTYFVQAGGYTLGPSMKELRSMNAADGIRQILPWAAVIGAAWFVLVAAALRRLGLSARLWLTILPLIVLVPALGYGGNIAGIGFFYRYAVWLPVPYALLLGAGAAASRKNFFVAAATATLLALNGVAYWNREFNTRYAEEDFRAVAAKVDELADPADRVVVASPYMARALNYYRPSERQAASFPIFAHFEEQRRRDLADFLSTVPPGDRFWIVSQWLPADDVRRQVRDETLQSLGAVLRAELHQTEIYEATR